MMFILVTTLGVLNLIIGIFCENLMTIASRREHDIAINQEDARRQKLEELRRAFQRLDLNDSGDISRNEFNVAITTNRELMKSLTELGLDEEKDLFDAIDADHSGKLDFNEFFDGATRMINGREPALAKDSVATYLRVCSLQKAQVRLEAKFETEITQVKSAVQRIERTLDLILSKSDAGQAK